MADGKCPPCKKGAPEWMATFSDMCQLLLTFFILLLSFAKTETAKYEAAMGSIRNAFGGNVLKPGEVLRPGKSPDDAPTMIDSDQPPEPFPIEFLTSEGLLDKHEVNRESDTQLAQIKSMLKENSLAEEATVYEMPESIFIRMKEKITFKVGSTSLEGVNVAVLDKLIVMMKQNPWHVLIEGHADKDEASLNGGDALSLSSQRAMMISRLLIQRGVEANRVTTLFYGDTRPQETSAKDKTNRRVEFMIKKTDLTTEGKKVRAE
jgi:chemotaxis protein MotB